MNNNYNKIKPIINSLTKYVNSKKRLWWTLGLVKVNPVLSYEIRDIIQILNNSNPDSSSTFKYIVGLLHYNKLFRKTKYIRESILEYIDNFSVKNPFDREDIAKYLELYAPRFKRPWWGLGLLKVATMAEHEESVLIKFRNHKLIPTNVTDETSESKQSKPVQLAQDKSLMTDSKILKIADDINNLSHSIYTELPKIDQKIQFEIQRISDDLQGLAKLIEILDAEVPFNIQSIKHEISSVLDSFNNVIKQSSNAIKEKALSDASKSSTNNTKTRTNSHTQVVNQLKGQLAAKSLSNNNHSKPSSPATPAAGSPVTSGSKFNLLNKTNINQTQTLISRPRVSQQQINGNQNNKTTKSYVNKELTAQLHSSPQGFTANKYRDRISTGIKVNTNSNHASRNLQQSNTRQRLNTIEHNSPYSRSYQHIKAEQESASKPAQDDDNFYNAQMFNSHISANYNIADINQEEISESAADLSLEQLNEKISKEPNKIYTITFNDPNQQLPDVQVYLSHQEKELVVDNQSFDLNSQNGLQELQNYLEIGRQNTQHINLLDIITKFIYDTPLTINELENIGLCTAD